MRLVAQLQASLIGAIVTGRVLGALPRLALTALIGSGQALQETCAAEGSRHALSGMLDGRLALDIGVLAACPLVSLVSVRRGMGWGLT